MSSSVRQLPSGVPTVNLENYASEAILPRMPYEQRPSQPTNGRSPSDQRNLKSVHRIPKDEFFDRVKSYFKARPPSVFSKSPGNWSLRVSHTNYPGIPDAGVLPAEDEAGVQTWVELVALQTALCLLHSAEPELLDLEFGHVWGPGTQAARSDVVFRMGNPYGDRTSKVNTLLLEVKCPWTLSLEDMRQISRISDGLPNIKRKTYDSARSVLAQVYDYCKEQRHCFWIITNYEYWVFGVFSADFQTALATEPIAYDNTSPTILQCIVYWLQSSTFRAGTFEIPRPQNRPGFSMPCSRSLWTATLRLWRENALDELEENFAATGYDNPKKLRAKCASSFQERNRSVGLASTWIGDPLQEACREVFRLLKTPSRPLEWTVTLTWLALLLDPIVVTPDLPCLEAAFKAASRGDSHRPNLLLHLEGRGRSPYFGRAQSVDPKPPKICSAGTAMRRVESLKEFYWSHASNEVAFILDKYLPSSVQEQLKSMLIKLKLWGPALQGSQAEESGSDTSSQSEEAAPEEQVVTDRAHSKRPSEPRGSDARATRASPSLLQDALTPRKTRMDSESAAGPSSSPSVTPRPNAASYSLYRSDSNSTLSPATPPARRAPNRQMSPFSPERSPTPAREPAATDSPFSFAGKGGDQDQVKSLTDALTAGLGGLTIQSPRQDSSSSSSAARPRSIGRSPLSANNGDGGERNPFFEPVQSLTIPPRLGSDSTPVQTPSTRAEGSTRSDDEGRVQIEKVPVERLVEDIKTEALLEYIRNHPNDDVQSFEDLVRQNKAPQETLDFIATILSQASNP